jgi:hypothetical protein
MYARAKEWSGNLVIRTDQPRLASIAILPRFPAEGVRQIRFVFEDNPSRLIGRIRGTRPCSGGSGSARRVGERALRAANIALKPALDFTAARLRKCHEAPSSSGQYLKPHSNLNDNAGLQTDFDL